MKYLSFWSWSSFSIQSGKKRFCTANKKIMKLAVRFKLKLTSINYLWLVIHSRVSFGRTLGFFCTPLDIFARLSIFHYLSFSPSSHLEIFHMFTCSERLHLGNLQNFHAWVNQYVVIRIPRGVGTRNPAAHPSWKESKANLIFQN